VVRNTEKIYDLPLRALSVAGYSCGLTATEACLILQYHRVASLCHDPLQIAVQPQHFERQIEYLADNFNVISIDEMRRHLDAAAPFGRRTIVVTFDGGYADVLYTAKEVLAEYGVCATVFAASANIIEKGQLWPDELEDILIAGHVEGHLEIEIDGRWLQWPVSSARDRFRAFDALYSILQDRAAPEQKDILKQISLGLDTNADELDCHRTMDAQELKRLEHGGLITIGGHTHNYVKLSALPRWQQVEELSKNKNVLEEVLGHKIEYFSYPFGTDDGYTAETGAIPEDTGFALACGNSYGTVSAVGRPNRYELPRVKVGNWNSLTFHRFLEGFFS